MRNLLIYIAAAAVLLAGCQGGKAGKKAEMGPEAVVETFTRHIAAGEFEQALELCNSASMQDYIDECRAAWERLQEKDSSVLAIASSLLEKAEFKVEKAEKTEIGRDVYYCIEAEGHSKRKIATLKKEEGEWRVEKIIDAI
jgi:hypothetical protein